jgi:hypothetical protein
MLDLAYVLGTIAFFAVMIAFVRACRVLGQDSDGKEQPT